jgi:hypothetical protein
MRLTSLKWMLCSSAVVTTLLMVRVPELMVSSMSETVTQSLAIACHMLIPPEYWWLLCVVDTGLHPLLCAERVAVVVEGGWVLWNCKADGEVPGGVVGFCSPV